MKLKRKWDYERKNSRTMTIPELVNKYKSNHEIIGCILNKRGTYGKEYYL